MMSIPYIEFLRMVRNNGAKNWTKCHRDLMMKKRVLCKKLRQTHKLF